MIVGCVIAAAHLVLFGTGSLALERVNLVHSWPFFLGFALVIGGLLLHAASPVVGVQDVVMTMATGVLGGFALPIAWFYFGFTGLGLESDSEVGALLWAYLASLMPVLLALGGAIFSWRTREMKEQFRLRWTIVAAAVSVAITIALIVFARTTFAVDAQ